MTERCGAAGTDWCSPSAGAQRAANTNSKPAKQQADGSKVVMAHVLVACLFVASEHQQRAQEIFK